MVALAQLTPITTQFAHVETVTQETSVKLARSAWVKINSVKTEQLALITRAQAAHTLVFVELISMVRTANIRWRLSFAIMAILMLTHVNSGAARFARLLTPLVKRQCLFTAQVLVAYVKMCHRVRILSPIAQYGKILAYAL